MAESLWVGIDTFYKTALLADLGVTSGLTTHVITEVVNTAEWEPKQWTLPVAIVNGETGRIGPRGHADGTQHAEIVYPYVLGALMLSSTYEGAREGAKTLGHRLMGSALKNFACGGLANDAGTERVQNTQPGHVEHFVWPSEGNRNHFFGLARLDIDVHATR